MVAGKELQFYTHLQLAEPPEERRVWGTNSSVHQHSQSQGLYFRPKRADFSSGSTFQALPSPSSGSIPPPHPLPPTPPGDTSQVEQKADQFMAAALGEKPGRAMSTQKQHCPTIYIPSPCRQRAVNICPIKSPHLHCLWSLLLPGRAAMPLASSSQVRSWARR